MKERLEAARIIREGKTFWVASHEIVDGDGLGSLLGLTLALRKGGKEAHPVNEPPLPRHLAFLPGFDGVGREAPGGTPDAIFILDTPTPDRLGAVKEWIPPDAPVIVIDHHVSCRPFGAVNIIDETASSAGEIVARLLQEVPIPLDREIATCLYTAIYTDTGRFGYSNTSAEAMEIAAGLLRAGADVREVSRATYGTRTPGELDLQKRVIDRLQIDGTGRLAWTYIGGDDLRETGCLPQDGHDFVDIPRSVEGVVLALLFREVDGAVRISLRSEGDLDVSRLAARFGGGGHRNSAGCTVPGTLPETMEAVVGAAREHIR
jgi:phosphoesterase RecJ-like protein